MKATVRKAWGREDSPFKMSVETTVQIDKTPVYMPWLDEKHIESSANHGCHMAAGVTSLKPSLGVYVVRYHMDTILLALDKSNAAVYSDFTSIDSVLRSLHTPDA